MQKKFTEWQDKLRPYLDEQLDKLALYQGYNRKRPNLLPSNSGAFIVDSMVARVMSSGRRVHCEVRGPVPSVNKKIESASSKLLERAFDDPRLLGKIKTFRQTRERMVRQLIATGATAGLFWYVWLDGVDGVTVEPLRIDQVAFNPAYAINAAPEILVETWAELDSLKANAARTEPDPETGEPLEMGMWDGKVLEEVNETEDDQSEISTYYTSGGEEVPVYNSGVKLLWHFRGGQLTVYANDHETPIYEGENPYGTSRPSVIAATFLDVEQRPYGLGILHHAAPVIEQKDIAMNQRIAVAEWIMKLKAFIKGAKTQEEVKQAADVLANGGVAALSAGSDIVFPQINPQAANAILPPSEYDMQIEKVARFSNYAAGVTNSATDKTDGTKGGIQALISSSEPNLQQVLDVVADQIDTPFAQLALEALATNLSDDEWRTVTGEDGEEARINRAIMTGEATVGDLYDGGMVDEAELQEIVATVVENGGTPEQALSEVYFDEPMAVRVLLDPKSAADRATIAQSKMGLLTQAQQVGIGVRWREALGKTASAMGIEGFDDELMTEEEMAQQAAEQQAAAEAEAQAMAAAEESAHRRSLEVGESKHKQDMDKLKETQTHELALKGAEIDSLPQLPA